MSVSPPPVAADATKLQHLRVLFAAIAAVSGSDAAFSFTAPPPISQPCTAGSYSSNGVAPCTTASLGHYVPTAAATSQTAAPLGYYVATTGASAAAAAAVGRYVDTVGASAAKLASPGYYVALTAQSAAKAAPLGSFVASSGAAAVTPAPLGTYVGTTAAVAATPAAVGRYVDTVGASAAKLASAGYYVAATGQSSAQAAAPGYFVGAAGASAATASPIGFFVSSAAATAASSAPAGKYVAVIAATAASNCASGANSYGAASACRIISEGFAGDATHAVSPRLSSNFGTGGTHAVGTLAPGDSFAFSVSNASTDSANQPQLTALTLRSFTLAGQDGAWFDLVGFTSGMTLAPGGLAGLSVHAKAGLPAGGFAFSLTLDTDQFADYGMAGKQFAYSFTGSNGVALVPEPGSAALALAGLGLMGALFGRRRSARA